LRIRVAAAVASCERSVESGKERRDNSNSLKQEYKKSDYAVVRADDGRMVERRSSKRKKWKVEGGRWKVKTKNEDREGIDEDRQR
jgi:hypothetical protein